MEAAKRIRVTLTMDTEMNAALDDAAAKFGLPRSRLVDIALARLFLALQKEDPGVICRTLIGR